MITALLSTLIATTTLQEPLPNIELWSVVLPDYDFSNATRKSYEPSSPKDRSGFAVHYTIPKASGEFWLVKSNPVYGNKPFVVQTQSKTQLNRTIGKVTDEYGFWKIISYNFGFTIALVGSDENAKVSVPLNEVEPFLRMTVATECYFHAQPADKADVNGRLVTAVSYKDKLFYKLPEYAQALGKTHQFKTPGIVKLGEEEIYLGDGDENEVPYVLAGQDTLWVRN